jgi:phenylpyruvate tautomerase PptA (4-oxalocrotonate tautomerase family)
MPMIDVYATAGTFADQHQWATDFATAMSNVDGESTYVRIQGLTNAGALDREEQLEVVRQLTAIVASAAADPSLAERTWVLLTDAAEGGLGLWGHAHTNAELVQAARKAMAKG